jgi:hypothetical protein
MGNGVLSLGVKQGWIMTLTTHPHLVLRPRMSRRYTLSEQELPPEHVTGQLYFIYVIIMMSVLAFVFYR